MNQTVSHLAAGTVLFGAGCVAYGTFIEAQAFTIRRYDVPVLPSGRDSVDVLHISDIHLLPWQRKKMRFLRSLASLEPDLVINTGDNHASERALPLLADCLAPLLEFPGVFVFGSNDYFGPAKKTPISYLLGKTVIPHDLLDAEGLHDLFAQHGWVNLMEHRHTMNLRGTRVEFRGTGDGKIQRDHYEQVAGPIADGELGIGVIHAPYQRILDPLTDDKMSLIVAGHTHGGQVCAPGYGTIVANCDLPRQQARGLSSWHHDGHSAFLHVTAGLGTSPYAPFRFACRPEAVLLRLRPRDWRPGE